MSKHPNPLEHRPHDPDLEKIIGWFQMGFNVDPDHEYTFNVRHNGTILPDLPDPDSTLFFRWLTDQKLHHVRFTRNRFRGDVVVKQSIPDERMAALEVGWFQIAFNEEPGQEHPFTVSRNGIILPEIDLVEKVPHSRVRFYNWLADPSLHHVRYTQSLFQGDTTGKDIEHNPWKSKLLV